MSRFDDEAKNWDNDPIHLQISNNVSKAILENTDLTNDMEAFEYGCGTGLLSFALHEHLGSITMADNSEGMLEVLNNKIKDSGIDNMHAVKLDLTDGNMPERKYDLIFTQMTLHHIPDTESILKTFHNMLHPSGYLCVADLDSEDGSFHGKDVTDVHKGFDRNRLAEKAKKAGFNDISFQTAFQLEKEIEDGSKQKFPIFLMIAKA
ncbi:MAG TPA: class I SAM-dependent methyltransferase [Balneolales bacterium]|nr:class I SAM-dependent methyltransferase [Balneolales bacterium]